MNTLPFSELTLGQDLQRAVAEMGFTMATPIQSQAIPHLIEKKDLIGQAQTGTGKTAAFGLPILENLDFSQRNVAAMIICPTRELAVQVAEELRKLGRFKAGLRIATVYGGDSMQRQLKELKAGPQIVVGTPGRLMDHLNRGTIKLDHIEMAVLDEADEMLNMGFREDIEEILGKMPETRQTVLFSATMPKPILDIAHRFLNEPVHIKVVKEELTNTSIEQIYYDIPTQAKEAVIARLIYFFELKRVVVFANMKRTVDDLAESIASYGLAAKGLHGDLSQGQRNAVLGAFRKGQVQILVATDVAARGIDVSEVDGVFNFDLPHDPEYYVHRIGRTGRAGKTGRSFSFVTGRNDRYRLRDIENFAKVRIERRYVPSAKEMAQSNQRKLWENVMLTVAEGNLEDYETMAKEFCKANDIDSRVLATALVKMAMPAMQWDEIPGLSREEQSRNFAPRERTEYRGEQRGERQGGYSKGGDKPYFKGDKPGYGKKSGGAYSKKGKEFGSRDGKFAKKKAYSY
jgi:ATP-dependent RNA helicase DeaD